ncbi:uncharacterized protein LOC128549176 [Mercenaria mercenaria]|uniref:uncharacterized protein LOC128549176 n=1 Tax=Mercenaria mercenaria TaxID=6596 RepID=UPI00234F27F6|nr:uncharacterized protein LOC128549176 [Mercenaria mercenaria]
MSIADRSEHQEVKIYLKFISENKFDIKVDISLLYNPPTMNKSGCIIISVALCIFVSNVDAVCDLQPAYAIAETAPNGTVIFNGTKTQGDTVTFQVKNLNATKDPQGFFNQLSEALLLTNNDTTFKFENTKPLDLEQFWISKFKKN